MSISRFRLPLARFRRGFSSQIGATMMRLLRSWPVAAFAFGVLILTATSAQALRVMMPNLSPAQQAIKAEVIVVGKVTELEKELTQATAFPNATEKVGFQIGVIKISESVVGAKGLTTIRVGWQPVAAAPANPTPNVPNLRPLIRPRPGINRSVTLTEGQEGCFQLVKHHEGDFYVLIMGGQPLEKKAADFDKQLENVKKVVKIFEDPVASLKAKEADERRFAAGILLQKYRMAPQSTNGKPARQEDISEEQSELIMRIMAESDWGKNEMKDGIPVGVQILFGNLGIAQGQHGFNPPKFMPGQQDYAKVYGDYVMKWIKDNTGKYRIQRWVASK
jgi:hypothetical protein